MHKNSSHSDPPLFQHARSPRARLAPAAGPRPRWLRAAPWLLAAAFGWLLAAGLSYDHGADKRPPGGSWGAARHLLHYAFGLARPRPSGPLVVPDPTGLLPGDVVLASRAGSAYGHFSHATAMLDGRDVLAHHVLYGVFAMPLSELDEYDHVVVLRAHLRPEQRAQVARVLRGLQGAVFNVLAHKRDPRLWQCAKSVWAAYLQVGIDLAPARDFIVPDDLAESPALTRVRQWGAR